LRAGAPVGGRRQLGSGEAEGNLRQALEIFQRIGTAEATDVAAELEDLTSRA
jgi:hypothetical protein